MARPMPRPPPVTKAILPASVIDDLLPSKNEPAHGIPPVRSASKR